MPFPMVQGDMDTTASVGMWFGLVWFETLS